MSLSTQEQKTLDLLMKKKYGGNNQKHSANPNQGNNQKHSAKSNQGMNRKNSANPNQGKQEKSDKLKEHVKSLTNEINGLKFQLKNIPISGPQIPRPSQNMTEAAADAVLGALARLDRNSVPVQIPPRPPRPSNSLKMRKAGDDKINKEKKVKFRNSVDICGSPNDKHTIFRCPEVTGTNHSQKAKNYVHLCRSFTYGGGGAYTCKFGNRCHFYHPDPRNMCPQGANCLHKDCRNFHPHEWYVPK